MRMLTAKLFRKSSVDDEASKADGSKPSTTKGVSGLECRTGGW